MASSAKYRNVQANPRVAFAVDEVVEETMQGARFLEVRGLAETATHEPADGHLAPATIRIHPRRVIAYNVDPADPGLHTRAIAAAPAGTPTSG